MSAGRGPRRAVLCVPATEPRKIAKAYAAPADEVVVDLEDAVSVDQKGAARAEIARLGIREHGLLAVRVNAVGTPWHEADVESCVTNPAIGSIVVPKAEDPEAIRALARSLGDLEERHGRGEPLLIQELLESPAGVHRAVDLAVATERVCALILGYADLSASMGRRVESSWQFAQDALLLAAGIAGVQAIDGPALTIAADAALEEAVLLAEGLGFDGKWVIHPAQVSTVQHGFTPTTQEREEATEILTAMQAATDEGRGAVQWRGRMLDEAVAVRARRILGRGDQAGGTA
ncbi:CoA ester lyase [Aeromicrobium sp. 636]|uniref:CoA ester lyase n=1 Tax=Aeromicrobium senzhongii TaxID=2663859 RepID=A0A8I0EUI0_9ACTN|nr:MULTISPECIES: CoA ester lyase [Aeromicrobium]MBC9226470.1 CoA ester lyase [Aeromicrobium senzhongii]MCQ3998574.1 CoA ester lyase [Aeromicrobium sp. 636]